MIAQDAEAFKRWLAAAAPGDVLAYHRGLLARDRFEDGDETKPREPLHGLALAALTAQRAGLVALTQRRRDTISFDYIATRTRRIA